MTIPPLPVRALQRLLMKAGVIDHRAALAKDREPGSGPRILLRVDEFPRAGAFEDAGSSERFETFSERLATARIPYLLAVTPRVADRYLEPAVTSDRPLSERERQVLAALPRDLVTFAAHGITHRTRVSNPRRRGEFAGLSDAAFRSLVATGHKELVSLGVDPRVYVAPFNRFTARQYDVLAERYDVICGGPETVMALGMRRSPERIGPATYLPAYPPAYGAAKDMSGSLERLIAAALDAWLPVVLHWDWESEDDRPLQRVLELIRPYAVNWSAFLDAAGPR